MTQVAQKELTILARAAFKNNSKAVVYQVLSSNGIDKYYTTVYAGKVTTCSCPGGHGRCYHKSGVQAYEDARKEQTEQAVIAEAVAVVAEADRKEQKFDVDCIHCRAHYPHTDDEHLSAIAKERDREQYREFEFQMGSYSVPGLY